MKFLAHLFRDEIKYFVERIEKAITIAKKKRFELVGTLRNTQREYVIVFEATEQGERIDFSLWQDNNKENVKMSNVFR